MSWLKIDDGFGEHDKIVDLTDRSFRLHVVALCYCARNLTDGMLKERQLAALRAMTRATKKNVTELVDAGLWDRTGNGYRINDYLDYNPSSEQVKERRSAAKERMRALRSFDISSKPSHEQGEHVQLPPAQSPAHSPKRSKSKAERLLDHDRSLACERLLGRIVGADDGTPRVVERFCKQLPKERIDGVTSTLRLGVSPAIAVAALKREITAYHEEITTDQEVAV